MFKYNGNHTPCKAPYDPCCGMATGLPWEPAGTYRP